MKADSQPALFTRLGFDPAYLPAFEDKLFIEGPQTGRRLTNFFALLLFATVIATYGVLSNSAATIIGAMLVAPLMEPMMATTAAVVMGSVPRALRALALAGAGAVCVILYSYLLSWVVPDMTISFMSDGEITSRIHPGLYALLTPLGAGAAGAFITSRAEIAEALGGVVIAIALVPPAVRGRHCTSARSTGCSRGRLSPLSHQLSRDSARGRRGLYGARPGKVDGLA
jgi:uncharacterized hydrophobic protein (TIGR00271 family)